MKIARALVAGVSGVGYPFLVGAVAAGVLTFTTARVFAESATAPVCDGPAFEQCSGATKLAKCAQCESCGCVEANICFGDGGFEPTSALFCQPLVTCDHAVVAACAGKEAGEWCAPFQACASGDCAVLDGGSWTATPTLHCAQSGTAGPLPPDASTEDAGATGTDDAGSPPSAAPLSSEDSGCSLVGPIGTGTSVLASAGLTLGMALLWRLRRRR